MDNLVLIFVNKTFNMYIVPKMEMVIVSFRIGEFNY